MAVTVELRLSKSRFSHVSADVGTLTNTKGGVLKLEIETSLAEDSKDSSIIATVKIDVRGLPKDLENSEEFVFKVTATVDGRYERNSPRKKPNLKDDALHCSLCQPLYTLAVVEARALAQKLGYSGITIPWDIERALLNPAEKETKKILKTTRSKSKSKTLTKRSTAKK